MLVESTLFGVRDKVATSIARLREFAPPDGYYLAFSGGKDSQCIYQLAIEAGVEFTAHYQRAVEPPELVQFIRRYYPDVVTHLPEKTMWQLIAGTRHSGFPLTRIVRYCCEELKERGGDGRFVVTGVRWAESVRRKTRNMVEMGRKGKRFIHPIIDWSEADVWEFLESRSLPHCCLYDEGFKRIGCVMCPMGGSKGMARDIARWPKIAAAYRRAVEKGYKGQFPEMPTAQHVWDWWTTGKLDKGEPENCLGFVFEG